MEINRSYKFIFTDMIFSRYYDKCDLSDFFNHIIYVMGD